MTKCKRKLLKIGIVCLMPLFAFLLCLNNTYAWYIDDNNNMSSSNLIDNANFANVGNSNGVSSDTGLTIQNQDSLNWGTYCRYYINVDAGTYTLSFHQEPTTLVYIFVNNVQKFGDGQTSYNDMSITFNVETAGSIIDIRFYTSSNITNLMLNEGASALAYEPYGMIYINPDNIDLMEYLLGNNYFTHGRVMAYQTSDGNYYDRHLYPTNSLNNAQIADDTINQYINGNILNLGTLCVDLFADLSTKSNYSTSNATFIALKPALSINGTATYPPVECRYIDLYIYCPNSLAVASCLIGGAGDIDYNNHRRVDFTKEGDYIHVYFDEDNYDYIWDIDIRIDYSNGWIFPQNVRCDLENNPNFNMYDLGVESGYQKGLVDGKQNGYNQGKVDGYNWGYERGKQAGYNEGISSNLETNGFKTLLNSIISYPINLVKNSLDFNFMGINVAQIVMFLISLGIVAFVIQKFKE